MYQYNSFGILIFTYLISRVYSEIQFNSLSEKLVLSLIKVTPKQNVAASEYLVRLSLCKLAAIATGDAKDELMLLLGYRDDVALSKCYANIAPYIKIMKMKDLTVTNRIYVNYTKDIDPKFYQNSSENYGVQVEKVGFNYPKAAIAHINNLVLTIRFKNARSSMTFVLPNDPKDLGNVLEKIYNQKGFVTSLTKGSEIKLMKITIPRFKIKTFVDWTGFLQGLGLYSVFNTNSSDLAGILKTKSQDQTISLSKVKQKVFVQIDEMGAGRSLPDPFYGDNKTTSRMPYYSVPALIVNRPFYFEIAWDLEHGRYEMFAGAYYGPEPDPISF